MIDRDIIDRFRRDVETLAAGEPPRLGIALSGGPDSLALLLLAATAWRGRIAAATVDHALRECSAAEARLAAAACARLGVPHLTLRLEWPETPEANLQAVAREARYFALERWAAGSAIPVLATAHHMDDQAETLVMRLARGAGLSGLASIRPVAERGAGLTLIRPLLGWRRAELSALVGASGIEAADDPSNRDPRFDRTAARALLADTRWLAPERLAAASANLGEAEEALAWTADRFFEERATRERGGAIAIDAAGLPRELQRRLLARAVASLSGGDPPPGPKLARLLDALRSGRTATLSGLRASPGPPWCLASAPPRRARR